MATLLTDKKYTVMLSAFQANLSLEANLIASARLSDRLHNEYHVNPVECIGVYHGTSEVSFYIHTNSSHTTSEIKRLGLEVYNQECVLVSNNRKHDIQLHNDDATTTHIGHTFKQSHKPSKGATCYTILNGCDYWSVK